MSKLITQEEFEQFVQDANRTVNSILLYQMAHGSIEEDARLKTMFNNDKVLLSMFFLWRQGRQG